MAIFAPAESLPSPATLEPTYAKEIRPKKSMAQIGILSQLAELNYPKLGK